MWPCDFISAPIDISEQVHDDADQPELPQDDPVPAADQRQVRGQPPLGQQTPDAQEPPSSRQTAHSPSEGKLARLHPYVVWTST